LLVRHLERWMGLEVLYQRSACPGLTPFGS
jgi:hypothetical protein